MNTDLILGTQVLTSFLKYFNSRFGFKYTVDQIAALINSKAPQIIIEGLGMQYRVVVDSDMYKMEAAMKRLSDNSGGRVPNLSTFAYAFSQEAQNTSFFDAVRFVSVESAKDIVGGVAKVGNSILATGNLILLILPIAVIGFGYFYTKKKLEL